MDLTFLGLLLLGVPLAAMVALLYAAATSSGAVKEPEPEATPAAVPEPAKAALPALAPAPARSALLPPAPAYRPVDSMLDSELASKFPVIAAGLRLPVSLTYMRPGSTVWEHRRLTVQVIRFRKLRDGAPMLYLEGYDHDRQEPRMFRYDRLGELTDLETGEVVAGMAGIMNWVTDRALGAPAAANDPQPLPARAEAVPDDPWQGCSPEEETLARERIARAAAAGLVIPPAHALAEARRELRAGNADDRAHG